MADIQIPGLLVEAKHISLEQIRFQTDEMIQEVLAKTPDSYTEGDFMFKEVPHES